MLSICSARALTGTKKHTSAVSTTYQLWGFACIYHHPALAELLLGDVPEGQAQAAARTQQRAAAAASTATVRITAGTLAM